MFKTKKLFLGFLLLLLVVAPCMSVSGSVTLCGNTFFLYNNGKVNLTFVDSCITISYFSYDTGDDYVIFDNLRLDCNTANNIKLNVSEVNSTLVPSKFQTVLRFNATYATGDAVFSFNGNHSSAGYAIYIDGALENSSLGPDSFGFTVDSWSTKDVEVEFIGFLPGPPKNPQTNHDSYHNILSMGWSRNTASDKEVLVKKSGGFPSGPGDGTELQNSTNLSYVLTPTWNDFFTVWSYNTTTGTFSKTGTNLPYSWGFNWSASVDFPKITDVINGSESPPPVLQMTTYVWIWFMGGWFFAALIGAFGVGLYMKYENVMVTISFFLIMLILLGGTSGIFFAESGGIPSAEIFVYIIGIFSAFGIGALLYRLFIKGGD